MSGSPVFSEQGTMGAIAYGFTSQDSPPYYFFATPIEWVIGARGTLPPAAKPSATWEGARIAPLEIPLVSTGLNGPHSAGGGSFPFGEAVSAGLTEERQESFEAGRPLAVGLLLGEITGGAIGTISYVDGDRIYGFGHPFDSLGPVGFPIIEAKVLGEISNLYAPFKFATLNPTVRGIITEDRLPAIRGVLEEEPELVPIRSRYTFPSGSELELTHRMPTVGLDSYTTLGIATSASFSPLYNRVDNDPGPQHPCYDEYLLCRYRLGPFPYPPVRGPGWKALLPDRQCFGRPVVRADGADDEERLRLAGQRGRGPRRNDP